MIKGDVADLFRTTEETTYNINDIWMFIVVFIVIIILKKDSLIFQYLTITIVFFIFSSDYGILYANIIFIVWNINHFMSHKIIALCTVGGVILTFIYLFLSKNNILPNNIFTGAIINIIIILSNLYTIYFLTKNKKQCNDNMFNYFYRHNIPIDRSKNSTVENKKSLGLNTDLSDLNFQQ